MSFLNRSGLALALWAGTLVAALGAEGGVMYRCPGNDYNNTLSAKEAKDKGCKTIEGAPITIIQTVKQRGPVPAASGPAGTRVDPTERESTRVDCRAAHSTA